MGSLPGVVTGLLTSGGPTVDVSALYNTISQSGQYQQQLINALPPEIQKNLQTYAASLGKAGSTYQGQVNEQLNQYLSKISGLYGPNSDAATAANTANKENIYSTVPGTQMAVRNALAATGGLQRGTAGVQLAAPAVQAAQAYGKATAGVTAGQTAQAQQAIQAALGIVTSTEDSVFQQMFGMSKEQAATILNTGNDSLKQQLAQLITQSVNQTNETLGLEGVQTNNTYQNAVAANKNQNALVGNAVNLGLGGAGALMPEGSTAAAIFSALGGGQANG